jgi:hypothetical protein
MKSIFLVNPISGRGHLDAYARLYSRALLELGYRVVLLAETDGDTIDYVARNRPDLESSFSFVSFSARAKMNQLRRALLVWRSEGVFGLLLHCARAPRILLWLLPEPLQQKVQRMERAIVRRLLGTRLAQFFDLAFRFDAGKLSFGPLIEDIQAAVTTPGHAAPDLIFFLYLDLMAEQQRDTSVLDRLGAWPWIGILFHPRLANDRTARIEGYFSSKNAKGGVFLVPSAIPAYAEATPHLHFALAPDVADLELPTEPSELVWNMRKQAGDRTIVLQIGSITAHKDIPTLLDVIGAADPRRFFFALIGEVYWNTFAAEKTRVRSFYMQPPENVYLSQGYIESERDYNGLITACDIIYAVYQNFESSSNSLTKAAGFCRPILVSEDSLMGERVRRANIGSAAPEGDVEGILEKLSWLADQPKHGFGFESYQEEQSVEALKSVLVKALPSWLSSPAKPSSSVADSRSTTTKLQIS